MQLDFSRVYNRARGLGLTFKVGFVAISSFCFVFSVIFSPGAVKADPVSTTVDVTGDPVAPSFTIDPAESPAIDSSNPLNAGVESVTFTATASDPNNENYYLAICKTNSITPNNNTQPTCNGGAWCVSPTTPSNSASNCSYLTLASDVESSVWYAFVCDQTNYTPGCSASSQGSGASGSPFIVNHRPLFGGVSNNSSSMLPLLPGGIVIFTTTGTSDSDSAGGANTVKLVVCKTAGISDGDCDGGGSDRWCQSALVASNPGCSFSLPSVIAVGSYPAYVYVFDNTGFASSSGTQGGNAHFSVSDADPDISDVSVNNDATISLIEGTTTPVEISLTVTDTNGCDSIDSVSVSLYRSDVGYSACPANLANSNNKISCYGPITCTAATSGDTCSGSTDASADYICTVNMEYYADPTDSSTPYTAANWTLGSKIVADGSLEGATGYSGVEVASLVASNVTPAISYGSLGLGQTNDPLSKIVSITNTGNTGIDGEFSGSDLVYNSNIITVDHQHYATSPGTAFASGTALSTTPVEVELNIARRGNANTWWGLSIPSDAVAGPYTTTITYSAVRAEFSDW